jgi:signal peptidase II
MIYLLLVASGIVVLDQLTKFLIVRALPLHTAKEIIPGFFSLLHVHNTGGAFSLLAGGHSQWRPVFFIALTIFVLTILVLAYRKVRVEDRWTRTAYSLICGGAVGNLIDRVRLGEVIDFLVFYIGRYQWPAFNVADSAITVGAVMLLVSLLRNR